MVPTVRRTHPEIATEKLLRALLLVSLRTMKQKEQVELLSRSGFGQTEIALLIGTSSKAVSVRLAEIRKVAKTNSRT